MGFWPMTKRPVKPVPSAAAARPGASCSSVAIADALTIGWRSDGTSTAGPSPIVEVTSAHRASDIQQSPKRAGES